MFLSSENLQTGVSLDNYEQRLTAKHTVLGDHPPHHPEIMNHLRILPLILIEIDHVRCFVMLIFPSSETEKHLHPVSIFFGQQEVVVFEVEVNR